MGYKKITGVSLTKLFVEKIENLILSGQLKVGEKLPSSRDLAEMYAVSRPVISAGIVELEKLGFVEIVPRKGVYVSDYKKSGTLETLVSIMRFHGGAMRKDEVISLMETRMALDNLCVSLVNDRASLEELLPLNDILTNIKESKDFKVAAKFIYEFHHELAVISQNVLLPLMYHSFETECIYLWTISCKNFTIDNIYQQKKNLYDKLLSKDLDEILACTELAIKNAIDNIDMYCL